MGVDTVTQGPPTAADVYGDQGIVLDAVNNVLYTFGQSHHLQEVGSGGGGATLFGLGTLFTDVSNAEVLNATIPANSLSAVGATVKSSGIIKFSSGASGQAYLLLQVYIGGQTIASYGTDPVTATNVNDLLFKFETTTTHDVIGGIDKNTTTVEISAQLSSDTAKTSGYLGTLTVNFQAPATDEPLRIVFVASGVMPTVQLLNGSFEIFA